MGLTLRVEASAVLPAVAWRWEPETDILAGALRPVRPGPTGSLELSGHDGSVAVVDLVDGGIAGLDVVVWPEVVTVTGLALPPVDRQGVVRVVPGNGARGSVLELEVGLGARANPAEDLIHLRVGAARPASVVQVADRMYVEVDEGGGLAGFWLAAVPPLMSGEG